MKLKFVSCFTYIFLIFSVLSFFSMPASSFAKPVSVVIYPNNAKITEHISADIEADGDHQTAMFFLPVHANTETLSVDTKPGSGLFITSVNIEKKSMPVADQVEVLKNRIKHLNQKRSEFEIRIKANTAYIDFWQTQAKNQPEKIESIDSVQKLGTAIKNGITTAYDEIYLHNQELDKLIEQIQDLQKQLDDLTGMAKKQWQISVNLTGKPQKKVADLTCSYHIRNCSWQPTYTINAQPAKSLTEIDWYAEIFQSTGIDWENVEIKIATAQIFTQPEPPYLRDWIIQPIKPVTLSKARRKSYMAEEAVMSMAPQMSADIETGAPPPEPLQQAGFSFDTYDLGKRTIKAGDSCRFTIREMDLESDFRYMIRPHATPQAFLFARIKVEDDDFISLPRGSATFLVDSAFISNRTFSMHDKSQKLFFGSDPQIDVELTTLEKKSDEIGFLMGKKQYQWGWKLTVNNLKAYTISVLIEDAYPQLRDERIKLKEKFKKPSPQKEDNLLKWSFPVLPQQETSVEYGFSITYPDEMDLSLGGR